VIFFIRRPELVRALLGAMLCLVIFMPVHAADDKQAADLPIDDVMQKVNAEQDEELYHQLTPWFQKSISFAEFGHVLRSVRARSGKLLTWKEQSSKGATRVYQVQGEKGSSIVTIAVGNEGRISGLRFTPVSSWSDLLSLRIFLILLSPTVIRLLMDRRRVRDTGKIRQSVCALFGAVVCPIVFMPMTPTFARIVALAVLGAACTLIVGNHEALELRLSRKKLQIVWTLFGAVFGLVVGLVMPPTLPTIDLVAIRQEVVNFFSDPVGSETPIGDIIAKTAFGAASALFFGNCTSFASWLGTGSLRGLGGRRAYPDYNGAARSDGRSGAWLAALVSDLRKRKKLVGLAARVMADGQLVACAAVGERQRGSGVSIELGDRWHVGSVTKSITATMIARLIESGKMQWSDSVGQRFPDAALHGSWKAVTLQQLLTHTAGAPANFSLPVRIKRPALGPECTCARRQAVIDVMASKPKYPPGARFAYSNVGYTIAGAMAETVTGVSWEDLVKREVFEPLELTAAGFGPPKSLSQTLDQPRGHRGMLAWKRSASDQEDNTPIMGPAGAIHMTLDDLSTYVTEHLRGELGTGKLLATETFKRLHSPELDDYACGWLKKAPTNQIPHITYWHNGSNTMWYALVVFIPNKNMTVAVTANDGDIVRAESAAWAVVEASANQF
jgi:CubicO group peptidase (beta-lactamase class C family)